jgi:pimeloyl-ACP methyl ester carboxylesterase
MPIRLDHANLAVRDLAGALRFLQKAFPEFRIRGAGRAWGAARILLLAACLLSGLVWLAIPLALTPHFRSALAGSPADYGLAFETVSIEVASPPVRLVAWWIPAAAPRGLVVLLHDGSSNRSFLWSSGLALAKALHDQGYAVLAPDLRQHGESGRGAEGAPVGANLAPDVSAWIDFAQQRVGALPAAAIGFGLGGPVALYAGAADPRIRAVVADSTWATLRGSLLVSIPSAVGLPGWLVRSSLWNAAHLYGIDFSQSRAVDVVGALSGRLLLVTNEEDPQVPRRELRALAAAAGDAEVWITPAPLPDHPLYEMAGTWGTHSRSNTLYPQAYARRVGAFLASRLE